MKNTDFEVLIVQVPSSSCQFINKTEHHKAEIQIPRERKPLHDMTNHLNASILKSLMGILRTNKMGQVFNESTELQGAYDMLIVTG